MDKRVEAALAFLFAQKQAEIREALPELESGLLDDDAYTRSLMESDPAFRAATEKLQKGVSMMRDADKILDDAIECLKEKERGQQE